MGRALEAYGSRVCVYVYVCACDILRDTIRIFFAIAEK